MLHKVLKPYTILPDDLYVERSADKQIRDIVDHMQRPGYVLVSRQMGKTNLLLRAKRLLNSNTDRFVYIDLSSKKDKERNCFQSIINTLLETNPDLEKELSSKIKLARLSEQDIEPNQEHLREIRQILNFHKGKIIIMLDEIDSLLNVNFTNNFFSHIRSIYFERNNFPELNRLTYILSGVAIPTEIIKNGKISPFNIGDKIYLNDFTKNEYESLLEKSELKSKLEKTITDYLFNWTSGNPRITFDLLNEIESSIVAEQEVNEKLIDSIINKLYLTQFDRPPIDHIRKLVQEDSTIRDAVIELHIDKGNQISPDIKNKLYLFGIINFFENEGIVIKNRIIKESLSYEWLVSLDNNENEILQKAIELQSKGEIEESINLIEGFLTNEKTAGFDSTFLNLLHFQLANGHFGKNNYAKAKENYQKIKIETWDTNQSVLKAYYSNYGESLFYLGEYDEAIKLLEYFENSDDMNLLYFKAKTTLANSFVKKLGADNILKAINIFDNILITVEKESQSKLTHEEQERIQSNTLYNIANAYFANNDKEKGLEHIEKGIKSVKSEYLPVFYIKKIQHKEKTSEKEALLDELLLIVEKNKLHPERENKLKSNLIFNEKIWFEIMYNAYKFSKKSFFNYVNFSLDQFNNLTSERSKIMFEVAFIANRNQDFQITKELLEPIIKSLIGNPNTDEGSIELLKLFCKSVTQEEHIKEKVFLCNTIFNNNLQIDADAFGILTNLLLYYVNHRNIIQGKELLSKINESEPLIDPSLKPNYLVIDYLEFRLNFESINKAIGKDLGIKFLNKYTDSKEFKNLVVINDDQINNLKEDVENKIRTQTPFLRTNKIERYQKVKVKYKDGSFVVNKYRKLINDIESGECVVIEVYK